MANQNDVTIAERNKLAATIGARKSAQLFTKIYNILCVPCKRKVLNNPRMQLDQYCAACKDSINKELAKYAD